MTKKQKVIKLLHKRVSAFSRKVAPIYKALEWEWRGGNKNEGKIIPDAVDIAISATKMLDDLEKKEYRCVSSGGITISIENDEEVNELMGKIEFSVNEEVFGDDKL